MTQINTTALTRWYDDIANWYAVAGVVSQNTYADKATFETCLRLIREEQQEFDEAQSRREKLDAIADILVTQIGAVVRCLPEAVGRQGIAHISAHRELPSATTTLLWMTLLGFTTREIYGAMEAVLVSNWSKYRLLKEDSLLCTLEELQAIDEDITSVEVREYNGDRFEVVWKGDKIGKHPLTYHPPMFKTEEEMEEHEAVISEEQGETLTASSDEVTSETVA